MLAAEPPVNAYELSVSMERSNTPYLPLTPTLRMNYDYGLAQLQEMFPEQSSDDLLFVLEHAMGDVPQATANMFARTAISPTKPKACHQVPEQFTDLFPRETLCAHSRSTAVSTLTKPQVTPLVNHCGQFCQTMKGRKLSLYRMWWPKACFSAHNPMPTNVLQLQRELSTRDSFANSADSSGSSVSGTPDLTSHRQASQPTAESIAKLPDFLQQLILSPADGNNKHVGQKVSSNTPRSGQDAACKVRQQIAQEYSQPDSTPQSSNPDLFWALSPDSPTAATDCTAPLFPDDDRPADAGQKLDSMKRVLEGVPALSDHILANTLREHQYNEAAAVTACIELVAMQGGDPDWSSESDVDGSSVTTDSYAEAESPLHTIKAVAKYWPPDDAEKLQASCIAAKLY